MAFKPCETCPKKEGREELCEKFRTCLDDKPKGSAKKGDKKPVKKGTYG